MLDEIIAARLKEAGEEEGGEEDEADDCIVEVEAVASCSRPIAHEPSLRASSPTESSSTSSLQASPSQMTSDEEQPKSPKNRERERFLNLCDTHLTPNFAFTVKNYVNRADKSAPWHTFSNEIQQLALTLYFLGPKFYKMFQSFYGLPSPITLKRVTSRYELHPGLNDFFFYLLSFKTKHFLPGSLECVLCADEIPLKSNLFYNVSKDEITGLDQIGNRKSYEPAKYALVLMLRSINVNWKHPVAYFFVSNSCAGFDLEEIILSSIFKLQNINIKVKAFVTDLASNFFGLSNALRVNPTRPYFEVNNRKIAYIFDPSSLLIATRNMFFQHNFKHDDGLIEKKNLTTFFAEDCKKSSRAAPKLTNSHICPGPFEKTHISLAKQVFSYRVAAAMERYLRSDFLPDSSWPTINFIVNMNNLFDIFNSSKLSTRIRHDSNPFNKPFTNSDVQRAHLKCMADIFTRLHVYSKNNNNSDVTTRIKFIKGWLITIAGLLHLWESLKKTHPRGDYVLYPNRISLDCLGKLFRTYRVRKNDKSLSPTPVQFSRSLKKTVCSSSFNSIYLEKKNYIKDMDAMLTEIQSNPIDGRNIKIILPEKTPFKNRNQVVVDSTDYRDLSLSQQNTFARVCGFLMQKCFEKHNCDICLDYAKNQKQVDVSFLQCYFNVNEEGDNTGFENSTVPQREFYNFVDQLENVFINRFPLVATDKEVGLKLKLAMCNITFDHPCPRFSRNYLINYFVRFRIYTAVNFLNKNLITEKVRKNKKLAIMKHL